MNLIEFVTNYSSDMEDQISFKWNGMHADEFIDSNMDFRGQVLKFVLNDVTNVSIDLVRDLFRAETECSKEAWGIVDGTDILAQEMLSRGGSSYIEDFIIGKFQSFDASCGCAFDADEKLAQYLLDSVNSKIGNEPNSEKIEIWESAIHVFQEWLT